MKILLTCFFLSTVSLAIAGPFFLDPSKDDYKFLIPQESNEMKAFLQTLVRAESAQDPEDGDDGGDDGMVFLEGMFNVLTQVDEERAKTTNDESANTQFIFWRRFGRFIRKRVNKFIRKRYCPKQHGMKAQPKYLVYEQEVSEEDGRDIEQREDQAFAELQATFGTLRKLNSMKSKGLLRNFKSYINQGIRSIARKYFC